MRGNIKKFQYASFLVVTLLMLGSVGCSNVAFSPSDEALAEEAASKKTLFFPLTHSETTFEQKAAMSNEVTLLAEITQSGTTVNNITESDLSLAEGAVAIPDFKISQESSKKDQVVDIVFVVDVTGTMTEFIETAKVRLKKFILDSRAQGFHTRMCLSTFGDYTVKKCDRFFDNDPNDASTMSQTNELISELAKLRAFKGAGQDPGWPDYDENPMRALIDATLAPFRNDAQKFVILVTDAGFLYSPGNSGSVGALAPTMTEIATALDKSQVTVFGVTPILPGFTSAFQNFAGIVPHSKGEHFLFSDVIDGKITLDQIFGQIINRINSTYRISYVVDQIAGLDSTKPLSQRQITLTLKNPQTGKIEDVKVSATFPDGRPEYTKKWKLTDRVLDMDSLEVLVNGVKTDQFAMESGSVKFLVTPPPAAKIKVRYLYQDLYSNIRLEPVRIARKFEFWELKITINNVPARDEDLLIERDLGGEISITILESTAKFEDYKIKEMGGILLKINE